MGMKKISKDELISTSGHLFRINGYHNTSISDIAAECGLSKASVYHYTPSKHALAEAAIKQLHQYFKENISAVVYQEHLSEYDRLVKFSDALEKFYTQREGGCLIGNLALEVTDIIPELEKLIKNYFTDWISAIAHLLKKKFGHDRAKQLAEDAVLQFQGAVMMRRLYKDVAPITRQSRKLIALLGDDSSVN